VYGTGIFLVYIIIIIIIIIISYQGFLSPVNSRLEPQNLDHPALYRLSYHGSFIIRVIGLDNN
jgi:hypothetical protein